MKWLMVIMALFLSACNSIKQPSFDFQQTYFKTDEGFVVKTITDDSTTWIEFKITDYYETK